MPKVYIRTLGCPKNETDTEHLRGMLGAGGYTEAESAEDADVVIVNTCSFIDAARRESVDAICEELDTRSEGQKVIVSGCLVERYGPELAEELPDVDAFMSLAAYGRATEIVDQAVAGGARQLCFDPGKVPVGIDIRGTPKGPTAFVKISEGCDRTCTFCAIPSIRGGHRSRSPQAISAEMRWLLSHDVSEIVLVAQDMSLYGRDTEGKWMLPELLRKVGTLDGLRWMRMLYQYPRYVDDALLDAVAETQAAVPYFDLSLQHAAGHLVKKMKRWGDGDRFLGLIEKIRARYPESALRSAFIVGFPGETDADAEELATFLGEAKLDWAGFFPYSPEEGTEAFTFDDDVVDPEVTKRRVEILSDIQNEIADAQRATLIGRDVDVLVESREGSDIIGRTWREAPEVDAHVVVQGARAVRVGDYLTVKVTGTDGLDLLAQT